MSGSTRTDARFALFRPVARKPSAARPAARIRRAGEVAAIARRERRIATGNPLQTRRAG